MSVIKLIIEVYARGNLSSVTYRFHGEGHVKLVKIFCIHCEAVVELNSSTTCFCKKTYENESNLEMGVEMIVSITLQDMKLQNEAALPDAELTSVVKISSFIDSPH